MLFFYVSYSFIFVHMYILNVHKNEQLRRVYHLCHIIELTVQVIPHIHTMMHTLGKAMWLNARSSANTKPPKYMHNRNS